MRRQPKHQDQHGTILIASFMVVLLLVFMGAALMNRSLIEHRWTAQSVRLTSAFHLADAGIDATIEALWDDRGWNGSAYTPVAGSGGYEMAVDVLSETLRGVVSTGHVPINVPTAYGYQRRQVEAVLELSDPSPFEDALFTESSIWLDSNVVVDSYDSDSGAYGDDNVHDDGDIGTNATGSGTITLTSNTVVNGDVSVGPGGDPNADIDVDATAQITGDSVALAEPKDLTPAAFPAGVLRPSPRIRTTSAPSTTGASSCTRA